MQTSPLVDDLAEVIVALGSLGHPRHPLSRTAAATLARVQLHGPARLSELASAEGVSQPSMSALAARLVDQGLLRRGGDPQDARVVLLDVTAAGEALLAQRRADRAERLNRALADLSPAERARIADALPALTQLADALRRSPVPPEVNR
jgi:DNA-binding MarR family transcriptional regulator